MRDFVFFSKQENTFSYDRTKYTGDKELEDILKDKAKQRRKNKRRRRRRR